jgi:hypothetical protein
MPLLGGRFALLASLLSCLLTISLAGSALVTLSVSSAAAAPLHRSPVARAAASIPKPLTRAAAMTRREDHLLVIRAKSLKRCLRANAANPAACRHAKAALQQAGARLTYARTLLTKAVASTAAVNPAAGASKADTAAAPSFALGVQAAPQLTVTGTELGWNRVGWFNGYVLMRSVPGQAPEYSLVYGLSTTPPPAPGETVTYSVRTGARGSQWSATRSVTYPLPENTDNQAAPTITVTGQSLSWTQIAKVGTYVMVTKVPGQADVYSVVSGTSITPTVVPGATVKYSFRTAVEGSAWATEVSITYPAPPPVKEQPKEQPKEEPAGARGTTGFQPGINAGWVYDGQLDMQSVTILGAKVVRVEFPIEWTAAELERTIVGYAELGIRVAPLATFDGTMPTPAQAQGLALWAKAYGPGGTFWAGRSDGALAIQTIEFGNETSGGYQYGDNAGEPSYQQRAKTYAIRLKEAAQAISAAGVKVGMLAVAEDWTGDWMDGMFSAVPNLGSYLAGWVSHPYGPGWKSKFEDIANQAASHGAPSTIPIDVTEWGLANDNGRTLSENYGYNPSMSYQEAASTLRSTVAEMRAWLGSRVGLFFLYQVRDQQTSGASSEREAYFGALQHEDQSKGPYTQAAQELLAA